MSEADMMALEDSQGTKAARLFLEGMTIHHKGAIEMAQFYVEGDNFADAVKLARSINH